MKKVTALIIGIFIMAGSALNASGQGKISVSMASGTSGGVYYILGGAIASTLQKHIPNVVANSEATGGTSENIRLISNRSATLGFGMSDDLVIAYKGERGYKGKPAPNLRAIMACMSNYYHIVVLDKSPIKQLSDLKGKKLSMGPAGGIYITPNLLENTVGYKKDVDYKGQYLPHDQAANALGDGDVDVMITATGIPTSAISGLSVTNNLRLIGLNDGEMNSVLKVFSHWRKSKIPAGSYKGVTHDVSVPEVPVWLFTYDGVDQNLVYNITKAIVENYKELGAIHPEGFKFTLENAIGNVTIPFHPGAIKYFKEKGRL